MEPSPKVMALLQEMLDSGRTAEEVCHDCPELLSDVQHQWKLFQFLDEAVAVFLPDTQAEQASDDGSAESQLAELPQIPGYRIEAELGHGGMGVVYRAWHLGLNRPVALKMLLAGAYARPTERARFLREAQAVAALRHPNIVQVYDVGEVDGRPYFTMELVDGGNLAEQIRGVPQSAQKAAELIATLAEAVGVAHQSGIIHRDLKPGNILLTTEGIPKVTDFGLARRLEGDRDLTLSGWPVGTPNYMSPCQARGDKSVLGPTTDVYSLGAVLYDLITGRPPFQGESTTATLRQVLSDDPVPPARLNPRVPRDLDTICLKCLEKDPHRRYASASDLADDLRRFLRSEPIMARRTGWFGRAWRWARRRPAAAIHVVAAPIGVLLALALAEQWYWRQQHISAVERAFESDIREVERYEGLQSWASAREAAERARGRVAIDGTDKLRARADRVFLELDLANRMERFWMERRTLSADRLGRQSIDSLYQ